MLHLFRFQISVKKKKAKKNVLLIRSYLAIKWLKKKKEQDRESCNDAVKRNSNSDIKEHNYLSEFYLPMTTLLQRWRK